MCTQNKQNLITFSFSGLFVWCIRKCLSRLSLMISKEPGVSNCCHEARTLFTFIPYRQQKKKEPTTNNNEQGDIFDKHSCFCYLISSIIHKYSLHRYNRLLISIKGEEKCYFDCNQAKRLCFFITFLNATRYF